jgi:hypothetical protein
MNVQLHALAVFCFRDRISFQLISMRLGGSQSCYDSRYEGWSTDRNLHLFMFCFQIAVLVNSLKIKLFYIYLFLSVFSFNVPRFAGVLCRYFEDKISILMILRSKDYSLCLLRNAALTSSTEYNFSIEVNSHLSGKEISCLLCNPVAH